jgi:hypothetical protein
LKRVDEILKIPARTQRRGILAAIERVRLSKTTVIEMLLAERELARKNGQSSAEIRLAFAATGSCRTDFAAIKSDPKVIQKQLRVLPTRQELVATALTIIFTTMMRVTLSLPFFRR